MPYLTSISVPNFRNLKDVEIKLSPENMQHLIITGRNGTGKTSLFEELAKSILIYINNKCGRPPEKVHESFFKMAPLSVFFTLNTGDFEKLYLLKEEKKFIYTSFDAHRVLSLIEPKSIENQNVIFGPEERGSQRKYNPGFIKYLVLINHRMMNAHFKEDMVKKESLQHWMDRFESALRDLYDCDDLELVYDDSKIDFSINMPNRPSFTLNQMAAGYSALFDIMTEILMRMEVMGNIDYDLPGIALIDEVDIHLHVELQKKVLPFLTKMFPNVQFIVTTHSPFVVSSLENAVVFDLETKKQIEDMSAYSYESIIENYFGIDMYSKTILEKFEEYRKLALSSSLSEDEKGRLNQLLSELNKKILPSSKEIYMAFQKTELERRVGKLD